MKQKEDEKQLGRRQFLKGITLVGGLALLSSLVPSCLRKDDLTPQPDLPDTEKDSDVPDNGDDLFTNIAFVLSQDRAEGVRRAISLLDYNPVRGKAVVLKPNFNTADAAPGSTHNDTLRTLIQVLKDMGAGRITLAERSGPGDTTRQVMEKKGISNLAKELDFDVICLDELGPDGWVHLHPRDSHWENGFHFPRVYLEAESIVQTCCLKTHAYGGHFTLSLKNSVGMVPRKGYPYMGELHSSPYQRQMIAEINTAYSPDLIVLDGVEAFIDGGPARGTLVRPGIVLAGNDRVAIDAVGVAALRSFGTTREVNEGPIFQQDQISRAVELGLGIKSPDRIRFVTDDVESREQAKKLKHILLEESSGISR
ncbi:DUF362 domain-containing protein [Chloroflexota bacterium]